MTDIVDRLRHCSENCGDDYLYELAGRAADTIATLRAEVERMRRALEQAKLYVERDEVAHGRQFGTGNAIRAALAQEKPNDR
jgi:hypothetical protein